MQGPKQSVLEGRREGPSHQPVRYMVPPTPCPVCLCVQLALCVQMGKYSILVFKCYFPVCLSFKGGTKSDTAKIREMNQIKIQRERRQPQMKPQFESLSWDGKCPSQTKWNILNRKAMLYITKKLTIVTVHLLLVEISPSVPPRRNGQDKVFRTNPNQIKWGATVL